MASAPRGTAAADALQRFFEYGTQPDAPFSFTGDLDAPRGLGGTLTDATARVLPTSADMGETAELRMEVLDPGGGVLASMDLDRTEGLWHQGCVVHAPRGQRRVHDVGARGPDDWPTRPMSIRLERKPVTGKPVAQVAAALAFLAHFHHPNQLRASARHASSQRGAIQPLKGVEASDGFVAVAAQRVRRHLRRAHQPVDELERQMALTPMGATCARAPLNCWRY